jgi:hypothetical protein
VLVLALQGTAGTTNMQGATNPQGVSNMQSSNEQTGMLRDGAVAGAVGAGAGAGSGYMASRNQVLVVTIILSVPDVYAACQPVHVARCMPASSATQAHPVPHQLVTRLQGQTGEMGNNQMTNQGGNRDLPGSTTYGSNQVSQHPAHAPDMRRQCRVSAAHAACMLPGLLSSKVGAAQLVCFSLNPK